MRISLEEAERKIHPDVAKWETREAKPTVNQLRKASRVYKRPMAAFFLEAPPTTFRVPHDYRRIPGEPEPRISTEFLGEFRVAQYRRQVALEIAEEGELSNDISELVGSIAMSTKPELACSGYREKLEARMTRKPSEWRTNYDAFNAWREAIESYGVLVTHFTGVAVEEIRGYAITEVPLPVIGLNGADSPNARIFSLLHEFAHILLGKPGVSNLKQYPVVASSDQKVERWCNQFAAEVLIPESVFLGINLVAETQGQSDWNDEEIEELANRFFVSRLAIISRLIGLGKAPFELFVRKRNEYKREAEEAGSEKSGFLRYHDKIVRAVGKPFARIVLGAYDREAITASDLAEYLGMRLKHLGNVRAALSPSRARMADGTE